MERDRLGRRRSPEQERGLRPLHPLLPEEWISKALRVAMSESDWAHFEALVSRCNAMAPSQARAHGLVLSELLHAVPGPSRARPLDWMDWERARRFVCLCPTADGSDGARRSCGIISGGRLKPSAGPMTLFFNG